jgi:hypothetical protein
MKVHAVIFFLSFLCVREVQRFLGNDDRGVSCRGLLLLPGFLGHQALCFFKEIGRVTQNKEQLTKTERKKTREKVKRKGRWVLQHYSRPAFMNPHLLQPNS